MGIIAELEGSTFAESWEPAFRAVFGSGPCTAWEFWRTERPPLHPGWRFLPMLNHLTYGPSPRYPQHDDGRDPPVFEAFPLLATLRSLGRDQLCLRYGDKAWRLPPTEEAAEQARRELGDLPGIYFLFDRHADWGVLCDVDGTISIVGGDGGFIAAYLNQCGGEDALHRRLRHFDFGLKWGDEMRPWGDEYRSGLYRAFGWEALAYPNHGLLNDRQPDAEEFERVWLPALNRLVTPQGMLDPEATATWTGVPFRGHVANEGGRQYEFGLSDPHPKLEEYDALLFTLASDECWEICLAALDVPRDHGCARIVPPKVWSLDIPELNGRPVAVFGPRGDWILISKVEGSSWLAGEPKFIGKFCARADGVNQATTDNVRA